MWGKKNCKKVVRKESKQCIKIWMMKPNRKYVKHLRKERKQFDKTLTMKPKINYVKRSSKKANNS